MKYCFLVLLVLLVSCSFKNSKLANQTHKGHEELYSMPDAPKAKSDDIRIVIAATNDLNGAYTKQTLSFKDIENPQKQQIEIGGIDVMSSYFKILRQQYGEIILVDSGNIFSQKSAQLELARDIYSTLGYDAFTLGLQDFNQKIPQSFANTPAFFKFFAKDSKVPLLLGNLYEVKSGRTVDWPGTAPYILKEINGVKVGVLGIIPDDIVSLTPVDNRVGLFMEGMLQATLRQARLLRSLGAEIVVVITHQGISCGEKLAHELKLPISKVNFDPDQKDICEINSKMGDYLNRLPPKLVDVVIGGRIDQKTVNYVNGTLVLSNFSNGKSFSFVEFYADKETKKIKHELTEVHQPVMFCREFFKETMDCYSEDESIDHNVRTPAIFLGNPITPDSETKSKFKALFEENPVSHQPATFNDSFILKSFASDLIYRKNISSNDQLIVIEIPGKDLLRVLETDFNSGSHQFWSPETFTSSENTLSLQIKSSPIQPATLYKVVAALDDLQEHPALRRYINSVQTKTYVHSSWIESTVKDEVSVGLAASLDTVR